MPIYYPYGTALVTFDELLEKSATGQFQKFLEDIVARPREARLEFSTGQAQGEAFLESIDARPGTVPFQELGLHKPLTIAIRHVYTGDSPHEKDMLVTSAIKGMTTYDGAPRAVNLLTSKVKRRTSFPSVPATDKGTFLVFYSPAILDTEASLRLEIGFDKFSPEFLESVGSALGTAGKVPIFAAYSGVLVGAGLITKLVAKVAEALIDDEPFFREDETIHIFQPGAKIPEPGFRLLTAKSFTKSELAKYSYDDGVLVDESGSPYGGPNPYMVISLDGTPNDDYESFTANAAGAALIERFYKAKSGSETVIPGVLDTVKLFNDWKFRSQALELAKELRGFDDKQSEEYAQRKARFDALVKSILNEDLRPSLEG